MTRRKRRPELPGPEEPSAEVLDELLRAFSADPDGRTDLAAIDLTSPEVEALLAPTAPTPVPERQVDGPDEPIVAPPDAGADAAPPSDDLTVAASTIAGDALQVAASTADAVAEPTDADAPSASPADGAAGGVVGDPFLAGEEPEVPGAGSAAGTGAVSVISIVDGDLPDAVHVAGSLAPASHRATVVIEDDGEAAGTTSISLEDATSATRIEPRLRERRLEVKKAAGRRRLKWALVVTAVVALVVAALAVLGSSLFAIDDVRVEGAEHTTPEELAPIVAALEGQPVLRADTDGAEADLEQLPWVEDARVTTAFPSGATIELRERVAAAAFQGDDGRWRLIDDAGRVLAASDVAPVGYLAVSSSDLPNVELGQYGPPGLAGAATLARSLTPTMIARAADIAVAPDGSDLRLHFSDGTEIRFGAAEDLVEKLVRLETKLAALGDERVRYIDVSTSEVGQG